MSDNMLNYIFRAFWILFLAYVLVDTFCKSWNTENGETGRKLQSGKATFVGYDPVLFPIMASIYLVLCVGLSVVRRENILFNATILIDMILFVTIYFTLLLLILPVLRKWYTAKTCATLWLVPVVLYFEPYILDSFALPPTMIVYIPVNFLSILVRVWSTGFAIIFIMQVISHIRFSRKLQENSRPMDDTDLWEQWNKMKKDMELPLSVELRYCSLIRTPLTVGMRLKNTITYLPERSFTEEEAELIFAHELHHIQRRDTHTKFFLKFCCAFGWLHPLVWLAVRKAEDDLELSCDEIVLKGADKEKRKKYAELLLSIAGDSRGYSTCLSASAKALRYRLKAAMPGKSKRKGIVLLFMIMIAGGLCMGQLTIATNRGTLSELTNQDITEISHANIKTDRYMDIQEIKKVDVLSRYLSGLQADEIFTSYENDITEGGLSGTFSDSYKSFSLKENYFSVTDVETGMNRQFYIRTPINWEYIESLK